MMLLRNPKKERRLWRKIQSIPFYFFLCLFFLFWFLPLLLLIDLTVLQVAAVCNDCCPGRADLNHLPLQLPHLSLQLLLPQLQLLPPLIVLDLPLLLFTQAGEVLLRAYRLRVQPLQGGSFLEGLALVRVDRADRQFSHSHLSALLFLVIGHLLVGNIFQRSVLL